jgi:hypothetical protein
LSFITIFPFRFSLFKCRGRRVKVGSPPVVTGGSGDAFYRSWNLVLECFLYINVFACVSIGHVPGVLYPSRISTSSLAWACLGAGWGAFDLADMDVKSNLR